MGDREVFYVGPPDPVVEKAQAFVSSFWGDADGVDEVLADLRASVRVARAFVEDGLTALQTVLGDPSSGWRLVHLVEVDANHGLSEFTEAAARSFLERCVALAKSVLAA